MFAPPDSTDRPGCTPRRDGYGSALDQGRPSAPPQSDPMGDGVPSWVERDFRAYLRCGILAHGFARARCAGCGYDFLVAFSCAVLRILLRGIRTTLRQASPGAGPGAQIGAISFLHRFGAFLNAHFHFHEATHLTASDWDELQHTIRHRALRYFHRHGLLERLALLIHPPRIHRHRYHGVLAPNASVPDSGPGPCGISCPSTHPIVSSLHGRTASVHLNLRSALQGEDLASLKQGAGLEKGLWNVYPLRGILFL